MKDLLSYFVIAALVMMIAACNGTPDNNDEPVVEISVTEVPCIEGQTIEIPCDLLGEGAVIYLPCFDDSTVTCGDQTYKALADTIQGPRADTIQISELKTIPSSLNKNINLKTD